MPSDDMSKLFGVERILLMIISFDILAPVKAMMLWFVRISSAMERRLKRRTSNTRAVPVTFLREKVFFICGFCW